MADIHATHTAVYPIGGRFPGFGIPEELVSRRPVNRNRARIRLLRSRYGYATIPHRVTKVRWTSVYMGTQPSTP